MRSSLRRAVAALAFISVVLCKVECPMSKVQCLMTKVQRPLTRVHRLSKLQLLMSNYSPQSAIRPSYPSSYVRLTVSDTGNGIPESFLPFVFDRFRQAEGSISRKQGGLGLGLAVARHLVELHGGNIRAESPGGDGLRRGPDRVHPVCVRL